MGIIADEQSIVEGIDELTECARAGNIYVITEMSATVPTKEGTTENVEKAMTKSRKNLGISRQQKRIKGRNWWKKQRDRN